MPDPQAMTPEQVRVGVAAIEWFHTIDNWGGPECSPKEGFEFASVTGDLLIPETHVDLLDHRRPAMAFYPGGELGGDVTNWWGPNGPALLGLLRTAGFQRLEVVNPPTAKVLCIGRCVRSTTCSRRGTASTTRSAGGA